MALPERHDEPADSGAIVDRPALKRLTSSFPQEATYQATRSRTPTTVTKSSRVEREGFRMNWTSGVILMRGVTCIR